jgi:hypothetical protein
VVSSAANICATDRSGNLEAPMHRTRVLILVIVALLTVGTATAADRSLVMIETAPESGPALTDAAVELAAEIPGGYLAFLDDGALMRLRVLGIAHTVLATDDPATDVLVHYDVPAGDRHTALPPAAEVLHRGGGFTVVRVPHDPDAALGCTADVQRVFRRPLRFVTRPWDGPVPAQLRSPDADIAAMVATVDQAWLEQKVQALEDFGTRHSQYPGGAQASLWLRDEFLSYGYTDVTLQDYNSWNDNVVCVKPGSAFPDRYVVIGAHYDSINPSNNNDAPGADDNATGTVGVLAAARAMAGYEFESTVVFIAFSGEEQGLFGSEAWASEAAAAGLDVRGAIALDMLGYRQAGDAADIDIITNSASQPLRDLVDVAVADYVPGHAVVTGSLPFGASSDHASFWSSGYRAILFFEDTGNYSPYIHSSSDIVGLSVNDFAFMERNVETAVATLALMAGPFDIAIAHDPLANTDQVGPFPVTCEIVAAEALDPALLELRYRVDGSPWIAEPLADTGLPDEFAAEIPAQPAGTLVEYYLVAGDVLARTETDPADAPATLHAFRTGLDLVLVDDGENDLGWSFVALNDDATTGRWLRADPVGTTYQPENDHTPDPGTLCFVTGNGAPGDAAGAQDVDGGQTTLTSPVFDLAGADWAEVSYWRYYVLETSFDDVFTVDISNDGGTSWTNLETVTATTGWVRAAFTLDELPVAPTDQMRLRFIAADEGTGSLVEALIDDVAIVAARGEATAAEDVPVARPALAAHPNPFNPATVLSYTLPREGVVELRVFDARGREVARPLAARRPAGEGSITWQADDLGSGVYLATLSLDGERLATRKLTLVR